MCRGRRRLQEGARFQKAEAASTQRLERSAKKAEWKAMQDDMGVVRAACPSRELSACLKSESHEWNEQMPKPIATFLRADKWCLQVTVAAKKRLARNPFKDVAYWMCSADSFVPQGSQWASWSDELKSSVFRQ